jgi:hypothetical protein
MSQVRIVWSVVVNMVGPDEISCVKLQPSNISFGHLYLNILSFWHTECGACNSALQLSFVYISKSSLLTEDLYEMAFERIVLCKDEQFECTMQIADRCDD